MPEDDDSTASAANHETDAEYEIEDLDETEELTPFVYSISSYGADYPVDALVKRINSEDILVPTFEWQPKEGSQLAGFQRDYVWPRTKADRFIESLLLGLPVPGVFLVKEPTGLLLVLDGHQRLHTLHAFYGGVIQGQEYRLANVQERFAGKRYVDLDNEDRRRLDDSIIHATVIRQDEPSEDQSSIYMIFERLNTGGVNLQPQEIRVALYHGDFVRVLSHLNSYRPWRELFGPRQKRLKDMEMILRFFAFYFHSNEYASPMKDFLNRYMASNRYLTRQTDAELTAVFQSTSKLIHDVLGARAFRPKRAVNAAVVDSLMTGVARRLEHGDIGDTESFRARFDNLLKDRDYLSAVVTGTSQEANVERRIRLAEEAFATVP